MKRRWKWLIGIVAVLLVLTASLGLWWHQRLRVYANFHVPQARVATVFIPGYGGNWTSFGPMMARYDRYGIGTARYQVQVHAHSESFKTLGPGSGSNPLINVLFDDAKNPPKEAKQLATLMQNLKKRHFSRVYLVGHSSGGNIIYDYLTKYRKSTDPQVLKFASLASDYPGETTMDRLPKDLHVLNLGGQVWHFDSDWAVNLTSLKHFTTQVKPYVASVKTVIIHGSPLDSYHSMLHQNPDVDRLLAKFLFTTTEQKGWTNWYNNY